MVHISSLQSWKADERTEFQAGQGAIVYLFTVFANSVIPRWELCVLRASYGLFSVDELL